MIPFVAALKTDLELARMMLGLDEVSSWARCCGLLMILGNSSCLTSLSCQAGTQLVAMNAMKWRMVHSPHVGIELEPLDMVYRSTDAMTFGLGLCSVVLLTLAAPCLLVATLPALLAYFYIAIPCLYLLLTSSFPALRCLLCGVRLSVSMRAALPDCPVKWLCSRDTQGVAGKEYVGLQDSLDYSERTRELWLERYPDFDDYDEEKEFFDEMGATRQAYLSYFVFTSYCLVFPWASAATARLLAGTGYWAALWDTWDDRRLHTFLKYNINASVDAMGEAAEATETAHTETVHGWLIVAQRWLVVLNHFI